MKTVYEQTAEEIGKLVAQKNSAYGSSFAQAHLILQVLYPNGIKVEQYTDALAIIRVIDKLFRIANAKDAFGESPWRDITGYGILGVVNGISQSGKSEQILTNLNKEMVKPIKEATKRRKN
jgi:selenophosphate synthase